MSAMSEALFDDYWFVLAHTGRARGPGAAAHPSAGAMRQSLLSAVTRKPQVMVKITSFGTRDSLGAHLDYISRQGKNEVFDPSGARFQVIGAPQAQSAREALQHYGRELAIGPFDPEAGGTRRGRPRSRACLQPSVIISDSLLSRALGARLFDFADRDNAIRAHFWHFSSVPFRTPNTSFLLRLAEHPTPNTEDQTPDSNSAIFKLLHRVETNKVQKTTFQ